MATTVGRLDNQEDLELAKTAQRHIVNALDHSLPVNLSISARGTEKPLPSSPLRLPPKDFPKKSMRHLGIKILHPDDFIVAQFCIGKRHSGSDEKTALCG